MHMVRRKARTLRRKARTVYIALFVVVLGRKFKHRGSRGLAGADGDTLLKLHAGAGKQGTFFVQKKVVCSFVKGDRSPRTTEFSVAFGVHQTPRAGVHVEGSRAQGFLVVGLATCGDRDGERIKKQFLWVFAQELIGAWAALEQERLVCFAQGTAFFVERTCRLDRDVQAACGGRFRG